MNKTLYNDIKSLLNPEIIQDIDQEKGEVTLKETDKKAKLKSVLLRGLDKNAIVFKLDKNKKDFKIKSAFLNPGLKGIHKGCDYVIIDRNTIIFCELKSKNIKGADEQLICSIPFIDYLLSLLKIHKKKSECFHQYFIKFSYPSSKLKKQRGKNGWLDTKSTEYKGKNYIITHAKYNKINIGKATN
ncbi:MAG: hypothetical protein B6I26_03840 [Desulfobacteraceae bacterium 4572_130]|nr:MAG: hypothetical protein B6I26_03840 [Desulfobacteraceae bacterium 4572_130]